MDRLWAMEVFVRVAECGSFSKAAESLNLANATVSASVRNLECHLNVKLISRDTRRLRLTEEGDVLLERAREFIESLARLEDDLKNSGTSVSGSLHLEMPISLGQTVLAPALPAFARRYPLVMTTLTLTNQPHNLIERAIDVAVRLDHVEDADLIARPLFEAEYVLCGTPELVNELPEHPSQLDPKICMSMLLAESRHPIPWEMKRGNERVVIQPQGPLHFNNADPMLLAASSGTGLGFVLDVYAKAALDSGPLVRAYPDWSMQQRTCYMVTTKARGNSAKVRAFAQFLLEILDEWRRPSLHRAIPVKAAAGRIRS